MKFFLSLLVSSLLLPGLLFAQNPEFLGVQERIVQVRESQEQERQARETELLESVSVYQESLNARYQELIERLGTLVEVRSDAEEVLREQELGGAGDLTSTLNTLSLETTTVVGVGETEEQVESQLASRRSILLDLTMKVRLFLVTL